MSKLLRQVNAPLVLRISQTGVNHATTIHTDQRQRRWQHTTAAGGNKRWVSSSDKSD